MARLQLRQFVPKAGVVSGASCSYSTAAVSPISSTRSALQRPPRMQPARKLSTSHVQLSSWPASAVGGHAETDDPRSTKGKGRALTIPTPPRAKTIADIQALKHAGAVQSTPIVCLTAHDFPSALSIRSADVDLCLIGDSLANVALGYTSTQPLTLNAMIHHCQAVKRGLDASLFSGMEVGGRPPLVIADMPFGVGFESVEEGVRSVVRLIQETGVDGVKIEGSYEVVDLIKRLTDHGVVVMGHLGLQPQRVGATSGYRVQGKTAQQAKDLLDASLALQLAGCFSIVLECIPSKVGEYISRQLHVPTIGIGAGSGTDGQILVMNDMIGDLTGPGHVLAQLIDAQSTEVKVPRASGLTPSPPKFVRNFSAEVAGGTSIGALRIAAVQAYVDAVRQRRFPDDEREGYRIKGEEWRNFLGLVEEAV